MFSNGDTTFGKTSAIDKNTRQFAFFSEIIASGSDLLSMPERSNVYLKYLIDETGSLTELTKRNYELLTEDQKYNLYQVQSIFKSEDTINIGLFDNQNPTKQQLLDGNKEIFAGGFKFEPVLWNRTGYGVLTYNLVSPKITGPNLTGVYSPFATYFNVTTEVFWNGNNGQWGIKTSISYLPGGVVENITIVYRVTLITGQSFNGNIVITEGYSTNDGFYYPGYSNYANPPIVSSAIITSVNPWITPVPGGTTQATGYVTASLDIRPYFSVHLSSSNVLYASPILSSNYPGATSASYTSEGFYFNGFDNAAAQTPPIPVYGETDYVFQLNPGDLIRLYNISSSSTGFSILEEYEISEVFPPTPSFPTLSFALNRNINLNSIQVISNQTGSIRQYIISRRIPDETNVVINYQKRSGQTSAGIVKNPNLAPDVDAKMANIVSDLKSKIFSTVLIP